LKVGLFNFSRKNGNDLGVDLGTVNTLVCTTHKGIVVNEPSVVAIDQSTTPAKVLEVGQAAKEMIGRTPEHIKAIRPLREGVIAEFEWAEVMLKRFIMKAMEQRFLGLPPRIVIGIPSGVTEVERRAVGDAAYSTGARMVYLVDEPLAAAIGAGMPVERPVGSMVVDIGGGTTEIAVLSLNGIVTSKSIRIAGDKLNEDIKLYMRTQHKLSIGDRTAEEIKIRLGSALSGDEDDEMEVRGISLENGLPHTSRITSAEIRECLQPTLMVMIEGIKSVLELTPPDLASDIVDRGIILAGGGALIHGLDELISREVEVPTFLAPDPLTCVVKGTEKILTDKVFLKILDATQFDPHVVL
jgi:rod shape-determining protein MreB and related proteins